MAERKHQIAAALKADEKLWWCAYYVATEGRTIPLDKDRMSKVFSDLKLRMTKGCWENLSHLKAWVTAQYGVPEERRK